MWYTFHINGRTYDVYAESKLDAFDHINGAVELPPNFYGWMGSVEAGTFYASYGVWD